MRSIRGALARVEVRLALGVGATAAVLLAGALLLLLGYAVFEAFEEKAAVFEREATALAVAFTDRAADAPRPLAPGSVAYRIRSQTGQQAFAGGPWPEAGGGHRLTLTLRHALGSAPDDYLYRELPLPDGTTLELAMPLAHFARERAELFGIGGAIVVASLVAAMAFGALAARRALRPLREATAAILDIDSGHLDARIPTRGTADDVDALADAINTVLARLEWAFGRLARFSADVAHELRTPLHRLLNRAEVALLEEGVDSARREVLEDVHESADEMRRLIEELLLLARGEEGRLPPRREPVDPGAIAARLVELYGPVAEASGQVLELDDASDGARIALDRVLIERALGNLLENALRHTPPGGRIRVSLSGDRDAFALVVEDSGPGIAEEQRERVFERFVQLDAAGDAARDAARGAAGAGLGLSIARMIARLHGGELRAENSPLGGAALRMTLFGDGPEAPRR